MPVYTIILQNFDLFKFRDNDSPTLLGNNKQRGKHISLLFRFLDHERRLYWVTVIFTSPLIKHIIAENNSIQHKKQKNQNPMQISRFPKNCQSQNGLFFFYT